MPYQPQLTKGPGSRLGPSFVGIPSLRRRSVGPPPSAIHGRWRLSRHPCRSAHGAPPAFSLHPSRVVVFDLSRMKIKIKANIDLGFAPISCRSSRSLRRPRKRWVRHGRGGRNTAFATVVTSRSSHRFCVRFDSPDPALLWLLIFGRGRPGTTNRDLGAGTRRRRAQPGGKRFLVTFVAFTKVTRCKSGTLSSRYRRNGYTPNPQPPTPTPIKSPT